MFPDHCAVDLAARRSVDGRYTLVLREGGAPFDVSVFDRLEELAVTLSRRTSWPLPGVPLLVFAFTPLRQPLDVAPLQAWGRRLRRAALRRNRPVPGYVRRAGPVHGIHRQRQRRYFRQVTTMNERRQAAFVAVEEGEVASRCARSPKYLADARNDVLRQRQRSWKSQHKGRKAWDRSDR